MGNLSSCIKLLNGNLYGQGVYTFNVWSWTVDGNSGPIQSTRTITLAAQLQKLGVKPTDIKYVVISHTHSDHSGNVDLFQGVPVLMQKAEYDAAFAPV